MKKLLALLLTVCVIATLYTAVAMADDKPTIVVNTFAQEHEKAMISWSSMPGLIPVSTEMPSAIQTGIASCVKYVILTREHRFSRKPDKTSRNRRVLPFRFRFIKTEVRL